MFRRGRNLFTITKKLSTIVLASALAVTGGSLPAFASTYTVTYEGGGSDGGTAPTSLTTTDDDDFTVAANTFTRTGYDFSGWLANPADANAKTTFSAAEVTAGVLYVSSPTQENVTLTAQWTATTRTITYDDNGSTGGAVPAGSPFTENYDSTYTVLGNTGTLAKTGYTFNGWNTAADGSGTSYAAAATFTVTSNVTLYAQWSPDTLTVTFDSNGGTAVANGSVATNAQLTAPTAPTRAGYTFAGWSTTETANNGDAPVITFPYTHGETANFTLYARWLTNYTVTFAAGNQSGATAVSPGTQTKVEGQNLTLPNGTTANTWFTRTGFEVIAWSINVDGSAPTVAFSSAYTTDAAVTYYPVWAATTRDVTYDANLSTGGSVPATATPTYNTSYTVASNTGNLVRAGYTFAGWNTQADGLGTNYTAGSGSFTITSNTTLYAKWTVNTLTVTFDSNGGTAVANGSVATNAQLTAPTAPTQAGYTFAGWSTTETANNGDAPVITFPYTHGETANFTLYARWTPNTLTVTFDSNSGTSVTAGSVLTNAQLTAPTAPTRVGFVFAGWSTTETNNNGNTPVITFPYTHGQTANFTLHARWTALDITVTYAAGGATGVVPVQAAVATGGTFTVATAANLSRSGYTFDGWSDGTSKYQPGATYTVGTSAVTLTAQWTVPSAVGTPVALPTNVTGSAGNASATVTWQITVGSGELTPTSYVVEFSTDGGRTWTGANATGTGLSRTVTGLSNGISYVFRVTAVATNSTATSAQSLAVTPVDPNPVVVPEPVSPKRVTIGTFNGFIAIYTVGYEGSRMSARVAGRWLTVNPITNVSGKTYSLTRRNTGAGFNIKVDVFIDGQLVTSRTVRTR